LLDNVPFCHLLLKNNKNRVKVRHPRANGINFANKEIPLGADWI